MRRASAVASSDRRKRQIRRTPLPRGWAGNSPLRASSSTRRGLRLRKSAARAASTKGSRGGAECITPNTAAGRELRRYWRIIFLLKMGGRIGLSHPCSRYETAREGPRPLFRGKGHLERCAGLEALEIRVILVGTTSKKRPYERSHSSTTSDKPTWTSRLRRTYSCGLTKWNPGSRSGLLAPFEDTHSPKRVPSARLVVAVLEFKMDLAGMRVLQEPDAVRLPLGSKQIDRFVHT